MKLCNDDPPSATGPSYNGVFVLWPTPFPLAHSSYATGGRPSIYLYLPYGPSLARVLARVTSSSPSHPPRLVQGPSLVFLALSIDLQWGHGCIVVMLAYTLGNSKTTGGQLASIAMVLGSSPVRERWNHAVSFYAMASAISGLMTRRRQPVYCALLK